MNTIVLHIEAADSEVGKRREELARNVRSYFLVDLPTPAEKRTICYLDNQDRAWLKQLWGGESNRGVHWPIRGQGLCDWPQDMWNTIAPVDELSGKISWPYDSVIYLHGSTCANEVQLAMTLAHELQHFCQYGNHPQLWALNFLLSKLPYLPTNELKHWYHLPVEREARIIAKRITESIFGKEVVAEHVKKMERMGTSFEDIADWMFIDSLDSGETYDLKAATACLVGRHRPGLEELQRGVFAEDSDFGVVNLNI